MNNIVHFILTRYNKGIHDKLSIGSNVDEWMEHRYKYFKNHFLKGIDQQTNKNFKVLLQFSKQTNFDKLQEVFDHDHIVPIVGSFRDYIDHYFKEHGKPNFFITSRCDNDDELLPNFVADIQKQNQKSINGRLLVDFPVLKYKDGRYYTYKRLQCTSPFLSVIEFKNDVGQILATEKKHFEMFKIIQKHYKVNKYGAMAVIHEKNLVNSILRTDIEVKHYSEDPIIELYKFTPKREEVKVKNKTSSKATNNSKIVNNVKTMQTDIKNNIVKRIRKNNKFKK